MTICFTVDCREETHKRASVPVLTQVAIGVIVLICLIVLIVVLVRTYKKQHGKYDVEKNLQQQDPPTVDTSTLEVGANSPSIN